MVSSNIRCGLVSSSRLLLLIVIFTFTASLFGCKYYASENHEYHDVTTFDIAGNTIKGCDESVEDYEDVGDSVTAYYKGDKMYGLKLRGDYEDWVANGRPAEDVSSGYYIAYTSDGSDHALLYFNNNKSGDEKLCWEIALADKSGEYFGGKAFVDMQGRFLTSNPVNDHTNSNREYERIDRDPEFYWNQASDILNSLDYAYFVNLDPENNILNDGVSTISPGSASAETSRPSYAIDYTEAPMHIGETVSVYGIVKDSTFRSESDYQPTYIDIGAAYPDTSRVSMVVWGEDRGNFPEAPESMYLGKTVVATGELYEYEGASYMKIVTPDQIQIIE